MRQRYRNALKAHECKENKQWKIREHCLIMLIKFIPPKWESIELKETCE